MTTAIKTTARKSDFDKQVEDALSRSESFLEVKDRLNEPQFKSLRASADENGAVFSGWDGEDELVLFNPSRAKSRRGAGRMPKGYKGARAAGFDSLGALLKSGYGAQSNPDWVAQHASIFKAIEGMSESVASDGGFLIPPEYAAGILEREFSNDLWSRTDNYTVGGNSMIFNRSAETSRANGSRAGGIRGYWTSEGGTMTDSKPRLKEVALRLKKLSVVIYMTNELMEDAAAAEAHARKKAREEFAFMLGAALFDGTGVGQPLGFLRSGALATITAETAQPAATIVSENIDKMWARRIVTGGTYTWYHNQDCSPQLDQLVQEIGTGGIALNRPNNSIAPAVLQTLKGAPRMETEFNETLGTAGDIALADLGQILSISKAGITEQASIHVQFLTDQTALKFTMRVDARPWEDTPLTPYKGSNTQSGFCVIATRA